MFYDRLIDGADRAWLHNKVKEVVKSHFKEDFTGLFKHLTASGSGAATEDDMRSLMFGDYMQPDAVCTACSVCVLMYVCTACSVCVLMYVLHVMYVS